MTNVEISLGCERDAESNMLVKIGNDSFGTLESFKRIVDATYEEEVLRKLKAAGVQFSMTDGVPKISVPASAAHLVEVEGYYPKNEVDAVYSAITDSLKFASEIRDLKRRRSL